jgi:D-xylose transport system ATP-binding protein
VSAPARFELRGITKQFPGVRALDDVSLAVRSGEIHALCGENGAGKSTLLKVMSGVYPHGSFTGALFAEGAPLILHGIRDAEAHGIALIAQELALVPDLSVEANLVLGREPVRRGLLDHAEIRAFALAALERVGLRLDPARPVGELGIGQRQLVEVAKALAKHAQVLVLDEPTAALPERDARHLLGLLGELRGRGVAVLYVSHRLDEVFAIADRITVLRDGRTVGSGEAATLPRAKVIRLMVGREVAEGAASARASTGDALLAVQDWCVADPQQPSRRALEDVSFELRAGEVLGVAGLMGAGRTALLASLFGAARSAVSGTLRFGSGAARPAFGSPAEALRAGIALVSEDRRRFGLVPEGSSEDNLALATLERYRRGPLLDTAARARACRAQADALRLRPRELDAPVAQLSGGNQQKVVLGRWLLAEPRVLLLDEPTRGIDVGARGEIYDLIASLTARGIGLVLVSSDLPELLSLSHRVIVLNQGRLAARFGPGEATPEAVMHAATSSRVGAA